jgi:SAM-dependent methyltransferase
MTSSRKDRSSEAEEGTPRRGPRVDTEALSLLARSGQPRNGPLSAQHADWLLTQQGISGAQEVLDLGCGWGEMLLRAIRDARSARGVGVDDEERYLRRARQTAVTRGVADRVTFAREDPTKCRRTADRVLCIGASSRWGTPGDALGRLRDNVTPGGRLLFGASFWTTRPPKPALEVLGAQSPSLPELAEDAVRTGWRPLYVDTATLAEWDAFEFSSNRELELLALADPGSPLARSARTMADDRRKEYLRRYRGALGYAYLVLAKE